MSPQYEPPLDLARALRNDAIDRMARAARRHIRYERVKALQMIARFRFKPLTADYSQKMPNAFWRQAIDEIGFERIATIDYDAPPGQRLNRVVVRLPGA